MPHTKQSLSNPLIFAVKKAREKRVSAAHYIVPCDFSPFGKNKRHIRITSSDKVLNQTKLIILRNKS